MIHRQRHELAVQDLLAQFPVVALLGARQVGKTTLARKILRSQDGPATVFDLEDPTDLERLASPKLALSPLSGLVLIDEIQRRPDLFPILRVLVDRPDNRARFLVLGSASPNLLRQSSETLAGRVAYYELPPLRLDETGEDSLHRLWFRGGFPRSFLAADNTSSMRWREAFIQTFLERDLPQLGISVPSTTMRRFWTMVAHYHGNLWNSSELSRSLGTSGPTVRSYLDTLTDALVVRQLQPWFENLKKRQVRSPRVYLADTGLLHTLLRIGSQSDLLGNPKVGASWESFAMQEVIHHLSAPWHDCFFWRTHTGAELDLLLFRGSHRLGFEFKRTDAPRLTRSMYSALDDLRLDRLYVIYPGEMSFSLHDRVRAVGLCQIDDELPA